MLLIVGFKEARNRLKKKQTFVIQLFPCTCKRFTNMINAEDNTLQRLKILFYSQIKKTDIIGDCFNLSSH